MASKKAKRHLRPIFVDASVYDAIKKEATLQRRFMHVVASQIFQRGLVNPKRLVVRRDVPEEA